MGACWRRSLATGTRGAGRKRGPPGWPCTAGYRAAVSDLELTGERTVPGLGRENYWFRRHEAAYSWAADAVALRGRTVVDAGSGEGYGSLMLRAAGAAHVVALEYDEQAAMHSARQYPPVKTVRANLDALPLGTGCVDVLVSMQVIEHLWDLGGFLAECRRVLRPGGSVIVATPNRLTFSPGLGRREKPTNPFHVEEFDPAQVAGMLANAGFCDVAVWGVHAGPQVAPDLVQRQVHAVLAGSWPPDLLAEVEAVSVADFHISLDQVPESLDLIGVGRVPSGS